MIKLLYQKTPRRPGRVGAYAIGLMDMPGTMPFDTRHGAAGKKEGDGCPNFLMRLVMCHKKMCFASAFCMNEQKRSTQNTFKL